MTNFDLFIYNTYLDILIKRLSDGYPTRSLRYIFIISKFFLSGPFLILYFK